MTFEEEADRAMAAARAAPAGRILVVSRAMSMALRDYFEYHPDAVTIPRRICKPWDGIKWRVMTDAQYRYAQDEPLRGYRGEESWNGKIHTCCGARVWYRHKLACPRLEGNAEWRALDSAA